MNRLTSIFFFCLVVTSCATVETYPLQNWWNEPQTVEQIELEYDKFLLNLGPTASNSNNCVKYSKTEELKLSRGRVITIQKCIKHSNLDQQELDEEYLAYLQTARLTEQAEWQQIKMSYAEGDELRTYSAPPFKGGFGIVLVRDGKLIHVYEQSFQ